jgi:hypothetical protein
VLLLVTGASGIGKTTVRKLLEPQVRAEVECVELWDLAPNPPAQSLEWRQRTTELAVQSTVQLQREGRHFLLCGDPIAVVELAAAPSAPLLDGIAVCLLDAGAQAQATRLQARGDDPALLVHHHAFADWMRNQAADPLYMLEVVTTNSWDQMRWDRIPALVPQWHVHTIDTTDSSPQQVADAVLAWIRSTLAGAEPLLRVPATPHPAT